MRWQLGGLPVLSGNGSWAQKPGIYAQWRFYWGFNCLELVKVGCLIGCLIVCLIGCLMTSISFIGC